MTRRRSRSARRTTTLSEVSTMPPYRFLWNVSIVFYVYGKQFRGKGERENYNYRVDLIGDFLWWNVTRPEGTVGLHVGVYCVRGRHRSTAMAWILSLMTQALGCHDVHTVYMERQAGNWSRLCTVCVVQ